MKSLMKIVSAFVFLGVLNAYAGENYDATVVMSNGKEYEVTFNSSTDQNTEPIIKIKGRLIPFDEINSIEPLGEEKLYIKPNGTICSKQEVRVHLTNGKTYETDKIIMVYDVESKNSRETESIVKIRKRSVPYSKIDSIELIGEPKLYIKPDGTVYSKQEARVCLTNDKTYKTSLLNFEKWLEESATPELNITDQTISQIIFTHPGDTTILSSR